MTGDGLAADLVVRSANVLTVDARDTVAQAVAVRGGAIVAVGRNADVDPLVGARTRVLDLPGKTVTPGFIDSHTHSVHAGEFRFGLAQLNLAAELVPSLGELLEQVRGRAARAAPGEWIGGRHFDPPPTRSCSRSAGATRAWPTPGRSRRRRSAATRPTPGAG